jgi:hypothetical protein
MLVLSGALRYSQVLSGTLRYSQVLSVLFTWYILSGASAFSNVTSSNTYRM